MVILVLIRYMLNFIKLERGRVNEEDKRNMFANSA